MSDHSSVPSSPLSSTSSSPYSFSTGDSVLALYKSQLFPAVVIQVGKDKIKVHYKGWNAKWDEWLDGDRVRKDDQVGRELMKELLSRNKRGRKRKMKSSEDEEEEDEFVEDEDEVEVEEEKQVEEYMKSEEIKVLNLELSKEMKRMMVQDLEHVSLLNKVSLKDYAQIIIM
jgi:hypothetical protein